LAAVFLLVATIAVLAAMARSVVDVRSVPGEVLVPNLVVGLLGGALIGGTIGIQYQQRVRSTVVGIATGGMTGLVAAAITIGDFSASMAFIDCALLIALAVLVRLTTSSRPKPSPFRYDDRPAATAPFLHIHRGRLVASLGMGLCAVIALRLISGQVGGSSGTSDWRDALSLLALALCSLGVAAYLLRTALRKPVQSTAEKPASPWD
jgi:hypothetical protein